MKTKLLILLVLASCSQPEEQCVCTTYYADTPLRPTVQVVDKHPCQSYAESMSGNITECEIRLGGH